MPISEILNVSVALPTGSQRHIEPRPGAQTRFLASSADVTLWVGEWMVGKTTGLLLDWLRHVNTPGARGVLLRQNTRDHALASGTSDVAAALYGGTSARIHNGARLGFTWPSGAGLELFGIDTREPRERWCDWLGVDGCEETEWDTVAQWMTRSRSTGSGIRPTVRLAGTEPPRGLSGPLVVALTRTDWPGPGASWMARVQRETWKTQQPGPAHGSVVFGPTREATAEIAGCHPEHVLSFKLITG